MISTSSYWFNACYYHLSDVTCRKSRLIHHLFKVSFVANLTAPIVMMSWMTSAFMWVVRPCSSMWIFALRYACCKQDTSFLWLGFVWEIPQYIAWIWCSKCFWTAWSVGIAGLRVFNNSHDIFGPWIWSVTWWVLLVIPWVIIVSNYTLIALTLYSCFLSRGRNLPGWPVILISQQWCYTKSLQMINTLELAIHHTLSVSY